MQANFFLKQERWKKARVLLHIFSLEIKILLEKHIPLPFARPQDALNL